MFNTSRFLSLAYVLRVSAALDTGRPTIPRCCPINSIRLGSRVHSIRASRPPAPGIYTLQDLIKKPPHQQLEADKFQRPDGTEYLGIDIIPMPIEQIRSKISQDRNYEALRPPIGTGTSYLGQKDLLCNQELLEVSLRRPGPFGYLLSPEEIESTAIFNFLRGVSANLFHSVSFPSNKHCIKFVKGFDPQYKISKQTLSNYRRRRPLCFRYLPISKTSLEFISFIKTAFPNFDGDELYAVSGTYVSYRKILLARHARGSSTVTQD